MQCRFYHAQSRFAITSLLKFLEKIILQSEASLVLCSTADLAQKTSDAMWKESAGEMFVGHEVLPSQDLSAQYLAKNQTILSDIEVDGVFAQERHLIYYDAVPQIDKIPNGIKSLAVIFIHGSASQEQARILWKGIASDARFDAKYYQQDPQGKWVAK